VQGSTGVTRTLAFSRYLGDWGWQTKVLSVTPWAYPESRAENLALIPPDVEVVRGLAFDTQRHLSLHGRYPLLLALPDRWQTWIAGGTIRALMLATRWRPDVVMSTYPIASAHWLGVNVSRLLRVPFVADFRDPMAHDDYPANPRVRAAYEHIERQVFRRAARVIVTAAGTAEFYRRRFPARAADISLIPNGYDDAMFEQRRIGSASPAHGRKALRFLHSGILYPSERDPTAFFRAVAELAGDGRLASGDIEFAFRACGSEDVYRPMVREQGIEPFVKLLPPIAYSAAIDEMFAADACMLFQASNCNDQIPAKLYEYLRVGKPIIGLTDPAGDTAKLLGELGFSDVAPLDDAQKIKQTLLRFIELVRAGTAHRPEEAAVTRFSRRELTRELATLFDQVSGAAPAG